MNAGATVVIVGAGQAGAWAARTLRELGHAGRIVLCGAEPYAPYERPPLSKGLITGAVTVAETEILSEAEMRQRDIEFLPALPAIAIDRREQCVRLADGRDISYARLLLATGGRPWMPPIRGIDSARVRVLRTRDDAIALREALVVRPRVAVIGGGWIGLETAATARGLGCEVTVIEAAGRLCARSVMPAISAHLLQRHRDAGVTVLLGRTVMALDDARDGVKLALADGSVAEADLVLIGAGMRPNDELAQAAGLDCASGVRVDASCRSSDPNIFAAGDVAVLAHLRAPAGLRLESWQNAQDQGAAAARAMLGEPVVYQPVPLVWSEQYEDMIQIAGFPGEACRTVKRDAAPAAGVAAKPPGVGSPTALYLGLNEDGAVVTAVGINAGRDFRGARKWVEQGAKPPGAGFTDCANQETLRIMDREIAR